MTRELSPDIDPESAIQALALKVTEERIVAPGDRARAKDYLATLRTSEAVESLRTVILQQTQEMARLATETELRGMMDEYIEAHVKAGDPYFRKHRTLELQRHLAFNTWKEIVLSDVWLDFFELFNQAYFMLLANIEGRAKAGGAYKWEIDLHQMMMRLVSVKASDVGAKILEMANYRVGPPHSMEESNLFNKLCMEITYETFGILLRFDFDKVLRGRGNKDPSRN